MNIPAVDTQFAGSIPDLYDTLMVPMIFAPYAADMARRLAPRAPRRVLEIAAGTGVVTRALDAVLDPAATIVATDLNPAMLERASARGTGRKVTWQPADAQSLPFADAAFDAVVCQFGVMFFPDKVGALAEARRVLAPGGVLLFNVWDRIEDNEFTGTVTQALAERYPADPPRFMARTPHGYHDSALIARDLVAAGFASNVSIETRAERSRAASAGDAARGLCQGSPLRSEIEAREPGGLERATAAAAQALAARFGRGAIEDAIEGAIQAKVVTAPRD